MGMVSKRLAAGALKTGTAAAVALSGKAILTTAGIAAVKHVSGRRIVTQGGAYVAGTLGAPAAAVGVVSSPRVGVGLALVTISLFSAAAVAAVRGH